MNQLIILLIFGMFMASCGMQKTIVSKEHANPENVAKANEVLKESRVQIFLEYTRPSDQKYIRADGVIIKGDSVFYRNRSSGQDEIKPVEEVRRIKIQQPPSTGSVIGMGLMGAGTAIVVTGEDKDKIYWPRADLIFGAQLFISGAVVSLINILARKRKSIIFR